MFVNWRMDKGGAFEIFLSNPLLTLPEQPASSPVAAICQAQGSQQLFHRTWARGSEGEGEVWGVRGWEGRDNKRSSTHFTGRVIVQLNRKLFKA